ncbi:hypothetical protein CEXT_220191 [Caerostris extrusa]|uniref:Uncharacterized protein n=1 Tax=Caerostris extrusa TaxID=172846 RepID=A0AAV4MHT5_CAEEX|nr:hypothetical protein CEXT_220191 [Caerostris extrusa]
MPYNNLNTDFNVIWLYPILQPLTIIGLIQNDDDETLHITTFKTAWPHLGSIPSSMIHLNRLLANVLIRPHDDASLNPSLSFLCLAKSQTDPARTPSISLSPKEGRS